MYKQAALNPIQPQRGWGLYFQKWKYFLPFYQHDTHRQTLAVIVKKGIYKWTPLNYISHKEGALFLKMEILSDCLLAPHPTHKLYFCSQTLAVIIKSMVMCKQLHLTICSKRGGLYFLKWKYFRTVCQHHTPTHKLYFVLKHWL